MTIDVADFLDSGQGVWWGQGAAEPELLVNQVLDAVDRVGPIRAFSGLSWNERLSESIPDKLTVISYGGLGRLSQLSRHGILDVLPCHYSAIPRLFAKGQLPNDLGLVQVSPPDAQGMVTLGIGVDYVADAIVHTRTLVAEVNHQMPTTRGGPRLPLSRFAAVIETDRPLREAPGRPSDDVDRAIANNVASIIDDGSTVQVGVGALPAAVLAALSGHRALGFHSGMITDGVLDLIEAGVITGEKKEIDPGVVVTGAALCTSDGYRRLTHHPLEFRAASYTHAPAVLSRLGSLVSVNSAIEVDLLGQVGAELARGVHIGAVGGQVDFSRAAALTGTRSIIALRSTAGKGERTHSTIVPSLYSGVVTTARVDVDAVVTEHGVAMLTGCTVAERALRLVEVAAPEYREALERSLSEKEVS
ncbi:acetyl-CoA hydrolase/transferase family protein [Nocardioides seonyuensis]|uniref:Acetyl-CoA hydrolase/transferase family protein n=1 Tax=Nocardioides seonyuensis TaxID=2518371 RepID=A0A4P7IJ76_9ACTN|nr:acetyl-CoA hydrolase/transferase C-terminal domain-containing protein [Nocardioides seonyuensis]QBX55931.1 acetyl-CoA hydrolase/transferase family protein [Nocardioides seonyuensis]